MSSVPNVQYVPEGAPLPYQPPPCRKNRWLRGEWDNEPDIDAWTHQPSGLACAIIRGANTGTLMGYVGVPEEHVLYGHHYTDLVPISKDVLLRKVRIDADIGILTTFIATRSPKPPEGFLYMNLVFFCHGGLTYAGRGQTNALWWFGFDAGHRKDLIPGVPSELSLFMSGAVYRNFAYMTAQVNRLAEQIHAYATHQPLPDGAGIVPMPKIV